MKPPSKQWEKIEVWAERAGLTLAQAQENAFYHPEIEWTVNGHVRFVPTVRKWTRMDYKVSKSDQL